MAFKFLQKDVHVSASCVVSVREHNAALLKPRTQTSQETLLECAIADATLLHVQTCAPLTEDACIEMLETRRLECECRSSVSIVKLNHLVNLSIWGKVISPPDVHKMQVAVLSLSHHNHHREVLTDTVAWVKTNDVFPIMETQMLKLRREVEVLPRKCAWEHRRVIIHDLSKLHSQIPSTQC